MKKHPVLVVAIIFSAITCGATFLFALRRQLALVEVAASLITGVELYLLSSSIGDWIERKPLTDSKRFLIATALALGVVLSFVIVRFVAE